jgi:2'-5' RNA ligase
MRTFIGIDFDSAIKKDISDIQSIVKLNSQKGRFKYIKNFHLTLKFLGEIESSKVAEIGRALRTVSTKHKPFSMKIDTMGVFNGRGSIHTLWLGLGGEVDKLMSLHSDIEKCLSEIGIARDNKAYTPHITIAQDLVLNVPLEDLLKKIDMSNMKEIHVKEIQLIKSEQRENKRIYTPIAVFPFI